MTDALPTAATATPAPAGPGLTVVGGVPLTGDRKTPPEGRVTWEEFLDWIDEDTRAEWVDGEIVLMAPSNLGHQDLVGFLYVLLTAYVQTRQLSRVYLEGVLMRLLTRPSGREPDLLFVSNEHVDRLKDTYLDGPADLVVEVVSPDSHVRDRAVKLLEYQGAGIPEYWLIDPILREAVFYRLGDDKRYYPGPIDDGIYRSVVLPGFELGVEWLWQQPPPSVADVMRALGV